MVKQYYKEYVKELENSKYHFIELNRQNMKDLLQEDIVFYSVADTGAMGEHGGVEILTKSGRFFHTNDIEREVFFDYLATKIPLLKAFAVFCGIICKMPEGYKYYDLGMGNSLLVKDEYVADFDRKVKKNKEKVILYGKWKDIALETIKSGNFWY